MSTDPPASRHRIAVVESDPELRAGSEAWERLAAELGRARPDLLVLNELPFGPWLAARERFDADAWQASIADHEAAIAALPQLGPPAVIGTRPAVLEGRRCNQAFLWTREGGLHYPHTKQHIPDSPGYRETTWTAPGPQRFATADLGPLRVGILICTDIMFTEHARAYGRAGAHLIAVPRATPPGAATIFDAALRMTAIVSGCYVATSNRGGRDSAGEKFGGRGGVYDPLGDPVTQTSARQRLRLHEIDTGYAAWKRTVYPCNVD